MSGDAKVLLDDPKVHEASLDDWPAYFSPPKFANAPLWCVLLGQRMRHVPLNRAPD